MSEERTEGIDINDLITVDEAVVIRGVTRATIWDMIRREKIRRVDRFGRTLVYRSEIINYKPGKAGRPAKKDSQ